MKLHVWCNTFIPRDIPGLTEAITQGPFVGSTCLPSPFPLNSAFLTDNRGFRKETRASSRLHARIVVDLARGRVRDWHRCGETIGIHRETGEELCRGRETTDRVRIENLVSQQDPLQLRFTLLGSCANPCVALAPAVDMALELEITAREGHWAGLLEVTLAGRIEPFPAFEVYVRRSRSHRTFTLLRSPVAPGATLLSMLGPANREVVGQVLLPAVAL